MNAAATAPGSLDAPLTRSTSSSRILAVFRLHFVNPMIVAWMPLMIYSFIFLVNWLIWLVVALASDGKTAGMSQGTSWSGASLFIFVWLLVIAVQAMNRTFHFALGFGTTRRDYYLGTLAALVLLAAGWSVIFGILAAIEEATGGWGLGGHMFAAVYFGDDGAFARTWYVFLLMLFFASIGLIAGSLFVRWKSIGLIGFFAVITLLILAAGTIIAFTQSWPAVGSFLESLGFAGIYALLLIPVVIAVPLGYLLLRRATARS